ncbi:hypothetical protein D910_06843 [Dendroctonus ponderosae]|uniref:Glutamyl-tRNA(Gln) amidotransferase subunit B, mitochondrial n=1 Tax=Dendroctonus ponderosae TaxID=77166 RepID=U4U8U7_DENPD|nr:hypothetical protein D910_06843 [Dendroctonus ponderosae]
MRVTRSLLSDKNRRYLSQLAKSSPKWQSVVGLEVHAQIASESKLFSGAANKFSSPINSNVSLFDAATPGTLPVLNQRCVEAGVLTALSLNCRVNPVSYFDRKHYFYADMPSGYQITQQRAPLAENGHLEFHVFTPGVHKSPYKAHAKLKQLQLEQDSGKSLHDFDRSLVDLNRAGAPLMELVFEPDLADGEEAAALIKELVNILQRIQTCSCKMEGKLLTSSASVEEASAALAARNSASHSSISSVKGAFRVDANVSVRRPGDPLGTRTEIKNIGSVRGVAGAIKYEIQRQIKVLEANGTVVNETRSWNPEKKETIAMRDKEIQQDYRYMPEPNLPPLHIVMGPIRGGGVNADEIKERIPELPEQTRQRLEQTFGIRQEHCIILVNDAGLLRLFEAAQIGRELSAQKLANFLINELYKTLHEMDLEASDVKFNPDYLGEIVELIEAGTINRPASEMVLRQLLEGNPDRPLQIVENNGWKQITDEEELRLLCRQVLQENEKGLKQYLGGKSKVFRAFMGAVYRKSNERADMKKCDTLLKEILGELSKRKVD